MDTSFYLSKLYPFQDRVLEIANTADTPFYLTGGTAAARGYLNDHRFSDDLDLFVNDDDLFGIWTGRCIEALLSQGVWRINIVRRDERFARLEVKEEDLVLRLEFINDVPARVGETQIHPYLGRIDTAENILANKVTAVLDRQAPKDLADVWGFCVKLGLSLDEAITNAQSKAAGIFPPDLARVLLSASIDDWRLIRWHNGPNADQFVSDLHALGEGLLLLE
ncbi:MAG: nucleotidyl transferase AbiEii/AbiGii toxin family protein [Caldilineales bacterium]|nr:nucleotidyl transferase AbiEii/AbiGii toxin family protein [Caldilineales bacterium]